MAGLLLAALAGCVKPYQAPVPDADRRYVVVDGFINPRGTSTFTLTRTLPLTGKAPEPVVWAALRIEDETGTSYPLAERQPGTYTSAALTLDAARRYRLSFSTPDGHRYQSDLVPVKMTPPVDQVSWQRVGSDIRVLVSTHDDAGQSVYYRWNYQETWHYQSVFLSRLVYERHADSTAKFYRRRDLIYDCWQTAPSTTVNLGNTAALARDVLTDQPLLTIPDKSERLRIRYSILVQQMAQTADEYRYWEQLKGNTESIGSLYDPLPTQLTGNIRSLTEAAEPVLGYVGAHSVTEKRLFINFSDLDLPLSYPSETGYKDCSRTPQQFNPFDARQAFASPSYLPIEPVYDDSGRLVGILGGPTGCVDCRLKGGTNQPPAFW